MPSVVSIPPNISTAAFATTSSTPRPARAAASIRESAASMPEATCACSWANASAPSGVTCRPAETPVTESEIAVYQSSTVEAEAGGSPSE